MLRRPMRWALVACLLLGIAWPGPSTAAPRAASAATATAWARIVIDSAGVVGAHLSLAVRPDTGQPHIAYFDDTADDLKLAFPAAGSGDCGPANTWSCNSLLFTNSDDFGRWPAIAFNANGQWGIAYDASFAAHSAYRGIPAVGASELFFTNIVEAGGLNSLIFNAAGAAELAYGTAVSATLKLGHARYVGTAGNCGAGKWQCQVVDDLTAQSGHTDVSIAILNGPPDTLIAYRGDSGGLEMAAYPTLVGTANCGLVGLIPTWWCFMIDSGVSVRAVSLAAAGSNQIHIAYVDLSTEKLKYAVFAPGAGNCGGGDWRCIVVDDAHPEPNGYGVSLALWNGSPMIAYSGKDQLGRSIVKVARPQAGGNCAILLPINVPTWQCDVVDDGLRLNGYHQMGGALELAFGPGGRAYIAYHDAADGDLLLAMQMYPLWLPLLRKS